VGFGELCRGGRCVAVLLCQPLRLFVKNSAKRRRGTGGGGGRRERGGTGGKFFPIRNLWRREKHQFAGAALISLAASFRGSVGKRGGGGGVGKGMEGKPRSFLRAHGLILIQRRRGTRGWAP